MGAQAPQQPQPSTPASTPDVLNASAQSPNLPPISPELKNFLIKALQPNGKFYMPKTDDKPQNQLNNVVPKIRS